MKQQNVISDANAQHVVIDKVLYTGRVHITGGREGTAKSQDGRLDINLSTPGGPGMGTNPEQLLAAGWSACFIGAMKINAATLNIPLPADIAVDAAIDLATGADGYRLQSRLDVSLPGLSIEQAKAVVEAAHQTCPYSRATHGNIDVQINVVI